MVVAAVARPVLVWLRSFVVIAVAVVVAVLLSMWLMVVIAFEDWWLSADAWAAARRVVEGNTVVARTSTRL